MVSSLMNKCNTVEIYVRKFSLTTLDTGDNKQQVSVAMFLTANTATSDSLYLTTRSNGTSSPKLAKNGVSSNNMVL